MKETTPHNQTNWFYILLLILAGESVFILPFVLQRIFRPTVLETFELNNVQLGLCFSVYGIVALVSYLVGGPIADKYEPRKLIAISLWMTALGGILYGSIPGYNTLLFLYGYWGLTTIFLFWAPMIKAARVWGGTKSQGRAFGFLDGGRGMVGALFGVLGVVVFSIFLSSEVVEAALSERQNAFQYVIWISTFLISIVGFLVWFYMKLDNEIDKISTINKLEFSQISTVIKLPAVWLLMLIILCAYVGYKLTDIFSLYAKEVMMYDEVESAQIGTSLQFIRPCVGILIGLLVDRYQTTLWLFIGFLLTTLGAVLYGLGLITSSYTLFFIFSVFIVATGVYSARALYFAVMEKGKIPLVYTGTAVGIISLVGYTPDIFAGPIMGYLLDESPGITGHRHVFWMMAAFSLLGSIAAGYYHFLFHDKNIYPSLKQ